jgi:hypothetical protein
LLKERFPIADLRNCHRDDQKGLQNGPTHDFGKRLSEQLPLHAFPIPQKIEMIHQMVPMLFRRGRRFQERQGALGIRTQFHIRQGPRPGRLYPNVKAQLHMIDRQTVVFFFFRRRGETEAILIRQALYLDVEGFFRHTGRTAPGEPFRGVVFNVQSGDAFDPAFDLPAFADKGIPFFPTIEIATAIGSVKRRA